VDLLKWRELICFKTFDVLLELMLRYTSSNLWDPEIIKRVRRRVRRMPNTRSDEQAITGRSGQSSEQSSLAGLRTAEPAALSEPELLQQLQELVIVTMDFETTMRKPARNPADNHMNAVRESTDLKTLSGFALDDFGMRPQILGPVFAVLSYLSKLKRSRNLNACTARVLGVDELVGEESQSGENSETDESKSQSTESRSLQAELNRGAQDPASDSKWSGISGGFFEQRFPQKFHIRSADGQQVIGISAEEVVLHTTGTTITNSVSGAHQMNNTMDNLMWTRSLSHSSCYTESMPEGIRSTSSETASKPASKAASRGAALSFCCQQLDSQNLLRAEAWRSLTLREPFNRRIAEKVDDINHVDSYHRYGGRSARSSKDEKSKGGGQKSKDGHRKSKGERSEESEDPGVAAASQRAASEEQLQDSKSNYSTDILFFLQFADLAGAMSRESAAKPPSPRPLQRQRSSLDGYSPPVFQEFADALTRSIGTNSDLLELNNATSSDLLGLNNNSLTFQRLFIDVSSPLFCLLENLSLPDRIVRQIKND
jgi:hypothetical protein